MEGHESIGNDAQGRCYGTLVAPWAQSGTKKEHRASTHG